MTDAFGRLPRGRVLQYHNVTPAHFFAPYDPALFRLASLARQELATLVGRVDLALGVRTTTAGARTARLRARPASCRSPSTRRASRDAVDGRRSNKLLDDEFVNFLFVGRIAPNKKIEDHIRLAEHYKRYVDAFYRFIFVGRYDAVPRYYSTIRALMSEYRLLNERFIFTGPVPDEELAVYYRQAAVYISLSEHEGFCAPLLEAMAADVPVLAYAAAAVPETLGGAGVQFAPEGSGVRGRTRSARWRSTMTCGRSVIAGQRRRLADFGDDRLHRGLRPSLVQRGDPARHLHEARLRRPAIRRRSARRIRAPLPARRRAARRAARGRGADDVRARLRDLEERVPGRRPIACAASPSAGSPRARTRDIESFNRLLGLDLQQRAHRADEMEWLKQQGRGARR